MDRLFCVIEFGKPVVYNFINFGLNISPMKEIELLETQIKKLDAKDFDLNAWKQYTIVLLARIFGDNNQKISQIEKIDYDYSSWSLRDTTGRSSYLETCKKLGREILLASIDELKAFGPPDLNVSDEKYIPVDIIIESLEDELRVSQFRDLKKLVNAAKSKQEKIKELKELLKDLDKEAALDIIYKILSHPKMKDKF